MQATGYIARSKKKKKRNLKPQQQKTTIYIKYIDTYRVRDMFYTDLFHLWNLLILYNIHIFIHAYSIYMVYIQKDK